jgi:hypothetical protein
LNLAECTQLTELPDHLDVTSWIEIAGSGLQSRPASLADIQLHWTGVPIDDRIAFHPETITAEEILNEANVELRRVLLERMGFERAMKEITAEEIDCDADAGGVRRLLRIPIESDEPFVGLSVIDPSTGHHYMLRVPPWMETCRAAAAWVAGFDNPDDYFPLIET